jgi:hypothetical protein
VQVVVGRVVEMRSQVLTTNDPSAMPDKKFEITPRL